MTGSSCILLCVLHVFACVVLVASTSENIGLAGKSGVDVSFPIHHEIKDKNSIFAKRYEESMVGCIAAFSKMECDRTETQRLAMNNAQPKSQYNYTEVGFTKTRVPEALWVDIQKWYNENKDKITLELWPRGNTYINSWVSPTYMINLEDPRMIGGYAMKDKIWNAVNPIMSAWTGHNVTATSMYGIRVYKEGAILATHVDRAPLISSAIIQVAQDVDEPWPVEVISHDGIAHNITMQPGEMVLYESHTVLHGRPYPLKGRFYANIFVHFTPVDHLEMNEKMEEARLVKESKERGIFHELEMASGVSEKGVLVTEYEKSVDEGKNALHIAASKGDIIAVKNILKDSMTGSVENENSSTDMIHARDINDWQPIHEAVVGGHIEVLDYLITHGADLDAMTKNGGTPLWWARKYHKSNHPVIEYLENIHALDEGSSLVN